MAKKSIQEYAEQVITLEEKADTKAIAKWLWFELNKNKDYRKLDQVLEKVEKLEAEKNGKKLAIIRSKTKPSEEISKQIRSKLESRFKSEILLKYKKDENIYGGFKVEVDGMILDLSLKNSINKLKRAIT